MSNNINPNLNPIQNISAPYKPKPLPKPPKSTTQKTDAVEINILGGKKDVPPIEQQISKAALNAYSRTYNQPKPSLFKELVSSVYRYLKEKFSRSSENIEISRPFNVKGHTSALSQSTKNAVNTSETSLYSGDSNEPVDALPKNVEDEILRLQEEYLNDQNEVSKPEVNDEFKKLKDLISSLTSKNKLKLNENSELEVKSRNLKLESKLGGEVGISEKSQAAIQEVLNKLTLLKKDVPLSELKDLVATLKNSEWGKAAISNESVKDKLTNLENFIRLKGEFTQLTDEFELIDKKLYEGYPKSEGETYKTLDDRWNELSKTLSYSKYDEFRSRNQ